MDNVIQTAIKLLLQKVDFTTMKKRILEFLKKIPAQLRQSSGDTKLWLVCDPSIHYTSPSPLTSVAEQYCFKLMFWKRETSLCHSPR